MFVKFKKLAKFDEQLRYLENKHIPQKNQQLKKNITVSCTALLGFDLLI